MTNQLIKEFIESVIKGTLEKAKSVQQVEHRLLKGMFREFFFDELLSRLLPSHLQATSGIIVNRDGDQSNETDLIIYDSRIMRPWVLANKDMVPIECVVAAFEVKSILNITEFRDSHDKATNLVSNVWYSDQWNHQDSIFLPPLFYLFAFMGEGLPELNDPHQGKQWMRESGPNFNGICVAGKYSWMNMQATGWTAETAESGSVEEIIRFVAVSVDNMRTVSNVKHNFFANEHRDWIGQYIRRQPSNPR